MLCIIQFQSLYDEINYVVRIQYNAISQKNIDINHEKNDYPHNLCPVRITPLKCNSMAVSYTSIDKNYVNIALLERENNS